MSDFWDNLLVIAKHVNILGICLSFRGWTKKINSFFILFRVWLKYNSILIIRNYLREKCAIEKKSLLPPVKSS